MPVSGTTTTSSTDVINAQFEKVRGSIEQLMETTSEVAKLIKKSGMAETISEKLYRIPLLLSAGGTFGMVDANAGASVSGSGPVTNKLVAGFKYSDFAYAWSLQSQDTTNTAEQSVLNTFQFIMKNCMEQLGAYDDILAHGDGTGKLTGAASTGTANSLTFATSSDALKIRNLREGMRVRVYDSSASDFMASDATIDSINYSTKKVTFTANLSATGASGDYLVVAGITTNPPASFSASYPASSLTADDCRHGIRYFNDTDSANYVLGILKSSVPQLLPASYAAASNALTFDMVQIIIDQLQHRRNPDVLNGLIGIISAAQASRVMALSVQVTNKFITGSKLGDSVDLQPQNNKYQDKLDLCGITCMRSKRQPADRIDFINPAKWGRAIVREADFLRNGNQYIYEGRNSSGAVTFKSEIHIVSGFDYFTVDPGSGAAITGLTFSTDY